ncbi:hypothetical protein F5878DRAFT_610640 [Lentinula raphanica]|uniref:Uncharacterized protein n=1 Tax=Lentinula raphanica TaxID=153919 RepID=A0AA38PEV8_9AGAR|nr:hypothetical protein F5878DRAFT_610640 [Lentinula raphanica]
MVHFLNVLAFLLTVETASVLSVPVSVPDSDGAVVPVSEGRVVPRSNGSDLGQGHTSVILPRAASEEPYNDGAVRLQEEEIEQMKQFLQSDCKIDDHESSFLFEDLQTSGGTRKDLAIIQLISAVEKCNDQLSPAQRHQLPDAARALLESNSQFQAAPAKVKSNTLSAPLLKTGRVVVNPGKKSGALYQKTVPYRKSKFGRKAVTPKKELPKDYEDDIFAFDS